MRYVVIFFLVLISSISCRNKRQKVSISQQHDSIEKFIGAKHLHHLKFSKYKFTTEKQWDSLHANLEFPLMNTGHILNTDYKTFGWHLYSKGSAYKRYDFSLLWGISYFSYMLNPTTGSYFNIHQWKTTALIDSAKAKKCKVFLSVSNFGHKNNMVFLENPKAQETLIDR